MIQGSHEGQFQSYPVLYDNWLFNTFFLIPPKKREEEKENKVAKPGLNHFFRKVAISLKKQFKNIYILKCKAFMKLIHCNVRKSL